MFARVLTSLPVWDRTLVMPLGEVGNGAFSNLPLPAAQAGVALGL